MVKCLWNNCGSTHRKNPDKYSFHSITITLLTVEAPEERMERAGSADTSASYLQVVVKKHRGVRGARLPSSSSPEPRQPERVSRPPIICQCAGLDRGYATLHSCIAHHNKQIDISYNCDMAGAGDADGGVAAQPTAHAHPKKYGNKPCRAFWTQLTHTKELDGPDRIEVYQFGAAAVVARSSETRVERCARPLGRRLAVLLDELLAVPRLLLPLPILVMLRVQSCVLLSARDVLSEAARSVSELALTPALVTLQDALRPPLLCVARVNAVLRDALRPLWLILGDATEPLANLLAQIRLVQVRNCSSVRDV